MKLKAPCYLFPGLQFSVISCPTFLIILALSLGPPGIQGFRGEAGIPGAKGITQKPYLSV